MSATAVSSNGPAALPLKPALATQDREPSRTHSTPSSPSRPSSKATDDEANMSPDVAFDGVEDQEGAQAVLQPAMSAAASHLTSPHTPAVEKAAAMEKMPNGAPFDVPQLGEDDGDGDGDGDGEGLDDPETEIRTHSPPVTKEGSSPSQPQQQPTSSTTTHVPRGQMPTADSRSPPTMPLPWQSGSSQVLVVNKETSRSHRQSLLRPSRGMLESAFGPTRNRSRSAGQEALKRLQKAFPSFSTPSHLLPSFPSSLFGSSSVKTSPGTSPSRSSARPQQLPPTGPPPASPRPVSDASGARRQRSLAPNQKGPPRRSSSIGSHHSTTDPRLPPIRRVTSDDSVLYHSLSRASSLGDDDQFHHVRGMVNMRLQAIKESLPDVPNFRMPRIHTPSFITAHSFSSTDALGGTTATTTPVREVSTAPKDGLTGLDSVLGELTGDIVIMGGFRGSVLRSAEPPHQQCWAPVKLGFNMRKVNLEVGLEDEDEERMQETIIPSGMLSHIGPIDISRRLFKKLRNCENARSGRLRVWDYGYDWRLSPHLLSRKLQEFLETLPSNRPGGAATPEARGAIVIAHSLGGLITRHAVNQRPDLFAGVLYAGVPQRCINILGPMRNGDVVLLNEKLLTAEVNFSMRTCFVFLPEDGFCFVDKHTGEPYPVDFYDPQEWIRWALSPCMAPPLPAYNRPAPPSPSGPSLSSLLATSLRARAESASEKWFGGASLDPATNNATGQKDRTIAPQMYPGADGHAATSPPSSNAGTTATTATTTTTTSPSQPSDPERQKYLEYLTRTLSATRKFRSELHHRPEHQAANAYPPLAVMYGKSTPTVYAARVSCREAIPCADAYDDLVFRPGDGVVLAKEAMLPEGYAVVRGGRVNTERGHITMLGDLDAVGKALGALVRGRRKGIGVGVGGWSGGEKR